MKKKKSESIRTQLLGPLLILLILQAAIIAGTVFFGGVSSKLKQNEINILTENTNNTKLGFEKETIHHWVMMLNNSGFMSDEIKEILKKEKQQPEAIFTDYDLNSIIVDKIMEKSIEMLHLSNATGIFLVLNGPAAVKSPAEMRAGFYIRNSNPGGYVNDNSSLLMERGLPSLAEKYSIPLDSFWELGFLDAGAEGTADFYQEPFAAALKYGGDKKDTMRYAYLSPPFRLSPKDMQIVTYSVPIILDDGTIVGVYGLEMTVNQLEQILGQEQVSGSFNECWLLGIREKGRSSIVPVAQSGYLYNQYFNESPRIDYEDHRKENISSLLSPEGTKWYASVNKLETPGTDGLYGEYEWVIAGMARQKDLLSFYNALRRMLLSSMVVPLIFSLLGAYMIGRIVTEPIRRLVEELRKKSGSKSLSLERVHVKEIDELTETIEMLNRDVDRASSKMSGILEHANVLVGVFEYEVEENRVFCSKSLFEMLGWGEIKEPYCYIKTEEFMPLLKQAFGQIELKGDRILRCMESPEGIKWIEIILDESKKGTILGICTDGMQSLNIGIIFL